MKNAAAPGPLRSLPRPALLCSLGLFALALLVPASSAQGVDIGVRSKVMDKDLQWAHKTDSLEDGGHSKTFAIVAIDEVKTAEKLVKPVDQDNILVQLYEQLLANGFHKYAKGTKPDILLAVSYGRGDMANPYIRDTGETPTTEGTPQQTITGGFAQQLMDEKTPGYESKLQKASFEKLFIRVTAFEYPKEKNAKPKMLWKTVIVADDPDHRDLNVIAAQMLKAGAPYFDRDLKKPEVEFYQGMPEGQVNVGPATVVENPPKK
jgi:hypothetical protein